ncbi:MAG: D-alanyl-D-alanine carboxypeptidase [Bacteroidota bacterium]
MGLILFNQLSCKVFRQESFQKELTKTGYLNQDQPQQTGLLVVDVKSKDTLVNLQSDQYFTPASTTKLFTLYTTLKLLGDRVPALKYYVKVKKLYLLGTGDPTWLNPYITDTTAIAFLKKFDTIAWYPKNYEGDLFGPGWAWEDYQYYFSPEMGPLPLYGNVLSVYPKQPIQPIPEYFSVQIDTAEDEPLRAWRKNKFHIPSQLKDTLYIPYITSHELTRQLLAEQLSKTVMLTDTLSEAEWSVKYGIKTDSLLKNMLLRSDNFLAEQLMLMAASQLSDTLSFSLAKKHVTEHYLQDLIHPPRWVDGSGLSRYNLFTPKSMVQLLDKLYRETDTTRLFTLMPNWGIDGTFDGQKVSSKKAFIYAKSGSMGNVYNLCGYVKTKSGKTLLFSFMNNNFRRRFSEVRANMYGVLRTVYEDY